MMIYVFMYACMDGWIDVSMYVCMDGWMDGETLPPKTLIFSGQKIAPTHTHTHIYIYIYHICVTDKIIVVLIW